MKKALFFSYFWPPSGKASLLQPLKLVAHLPEFGIEPVVVTVNEESFTEKDTSMLALVPKELRVIRTKAWEPFDLYRKLLRKPATEKLVASETISTENKSFTHKLSVWLRMNLFIPDARIHYIGEHLYLIPIAFLYETSIDTERAREGLRMQVREFIRWRQNLLDSQKQADDNRPAGS